MANQAKIQIIKIKNEYNMYNTNLNIYLLKLIFIYFLNILYYNKNIKI